MNGAYYTNPLGQIERPAFQGGFSINNTSPFGTSKPGVFAEVHGMLPGSTLECYNASGQIVRLVTNTSSVPDLLGCQDWDGAPWGVNYNSWFEVTFGDRGLSGGVIYTGMWVNGRLFAVYRYFNDGGFTSPFASAEFQYTYQSSLANKMDELYAAGARWGATLGGYGYGDQPAGPWTYPYSAMLLNSHIQGNPGSGVAYVPTAACAAGYDGGDGRLRTTAHWTSLSTSSAFGIADLVAGSCYESGTVLP